MHFRPTSTVSRLIILGAGASVDYGLPIWSVLQDEIAERLRQDADNRYNFKEQILEWVNKIGAGKDHQTIDICMTIESKSKKYRDNGLDIENEIFQIMRDIFTSKYHDPETGWLEILSTKILLNPQLERQIAFVNYNYDNVLENNFLNFSFLTQKERLSIYRDRLKHLDNFAAEALYPHGSLYNQDETGVDHIRRRQETHKTNGDGYIDAVSCHESHNHSVTTYDITEPLQLYIIGLGSGLEVNLNNLNIHNPVSQIYITVHDRQRRDAVVSFLMKKYGLPDDNIHIYNTATELAKECFND